MSSLNAFASSEDEVSNSHRISGTLFAASTISPLEQQKFTISEKNFLAP